MISYNSHSYETKRAVVQSGDPYLFVKQGVNPLSAKNWIYKGIKEPIDLDVDFETIKKDRRICVLEKKLAEATALLELYTSLREIVNISLRKRNIRCEITRKKILTCVETAAQTLARKEVLIFIGISRSRYKDWRAKYWFCDNSAGQSCSVKYPNQLTKAEVETMKSLVTSKKYAHMPINALLY